MESYTGLEVGYEPLESALFMCRKGYKLHGSAPSRIVPGFGQEAECECSQVVGANLFSVSYVCTHYDFQSFLSE